MQRHFTPGRNTLFVQTLFFLALILMSGSANLRAAASDLDSAREAINAMEYSTAAVKLERYLKTHPDDIRSLLLLAKTYSWDNQFDAASKVYDTLIAHDPQQAEYVYGKAQALLWSEKIQAAIPFLEKAWSLQSNNAEILRTLILSLKQSGTAEHIQRASTLGKIALKKFPNMHWDLIVD